MGFVKVNFNGSIRDAKGGTGHAIQDPNDRLLATRGSSLFELYVPTTKFRTTWVMHNLCEICPTSI